MKENPYKNFSIGFINKKMKNSQFIIKSNKWEITTDTNIIKKSNTIKCISNKHLKILQYFLDKQNTNEGVSDKWLENYNYKDTIKIIGNDLVVTKFTRENNKVSGDEELIGRTLSIYKIIKYIGTIERGRLWKVQCTKCGAYHRFPTKYLQELEYKHNVKFCSQCGPTTKILVPNWKVPKIKEWYKDIISPFRLIVIDKKDNCFIATHIIGDNLYDAKKLLGKVKNFTVMEKPQMTLYSIGFYNDIKYK